MILRELAHQGALPLADIIDQSVGRFESLAKLFFLVEFVHIGDMGGSRRVLRSKASIVYGVLRIRHLEKHLISYLLCFYYIFIKIIHIF